MARIQILELPEGAGDERPPFVLVVDEVPTDEAAFEALSRDLNDGDMAERIGARAVLVFEDTIDIPANDHAAYREQSEKTEPPREDERAEQAEAKLKAISEAAAGLQHERDEARTWARHGYEISQRHCGWSDHGVAPTWLTEGWPPSIGTCAHLQKAAEYDEALTCVRNLPEQPEAMDAQHEQPQGYLHGYKMAIRDAKRTVRSFRPTGTTDG